MVSHFLASCYLASSFRCTVKATAKYRCGLDTISLTHSHFKPHQLMCRVVPAWYWLKKYFYRLSVQHDRMITRTSASDWNWTSFVMLHSFQAAITGALSPFNQVCFTVVPYSSFSIALMRQLALTKFRAVAKLDYSNLDFLTRESARWTAHNDRSAQIGVLLTAFFRTGWHSEITNSRNRDIFFTSDLFSPKPNC